MHRIISFCLHRRIMPALLLLLVVTTFQTVPAAADSAYQPHVLQRPLRLAEVQPLDAISADLDVRSVSIAPDASIMLSIGGPRRQVCQYSFADAQTSCTELDPVAVRLSSEPQWSPDARWIALHEDFLRRLEEPDIWLFDVQAGTFFNRTEDGVFDVPLGDDSAAAVGLDVLPVWSPNGDLYFFRYHFAEGRTKALELYRIAQAELTGSSAPVLVADLSSLTEPDPFPVYSLYNFTAASLDAAAVAPDGATLAFVVHYTRDADTMRQPENGIWQVNLQTGAVSQIISVRALRSPGQPEWALEFSASVGVESLAWDADGSGLLIATYNPTNAGEILQTPELDYYLDMASGAITPLMDLSDIPDVESFFSAPNTDTPAPLIRMPRQAVYVAASNTYVYFGFAPPYYSFSAVALPPDGSEPQNWLLSNVREDGAGSFAGLQPSVGDDGTTVRIILAGYLLTLQPADE